jgi:hypothetical protein
MAPSWHTINTAIWILALLLQAALVGILFHRGIARRYPGFAVLIVFYPLRAILLFVLSGHAAPDASEVGSDVLAAAEILFEAWLLVDLTFRLTRAMGRWTARRALAGALIVISALAAVGATLMAAPGRLPIDRTQVFFWWAMLALLTAAILGPRLPPRSANLMRVCGGFAFFSLCQLLALAGRAHAFTERSRYGYVEWSYVPAAAYIAVVMYWLVFLGKEATRGSDPAATPA